MLRTGVLLVFLLVTGTPIFAAEEAPLLTGDAFTQELERSISASWTRVPVRDILRRISQDRRVAILLDRRIDPTVELEIDLANATVRGGIEQVAEASGAGVSVLGNVVYVGPSDAARRLRTLAAQRMAELQHQVRNVSPATRRAYARKMTLQWDDLEPPANLVAQISQAAGLQVTGAAIPHDLWAASAIPEANVVELLTLVLIQFDLSFQWNDGARGIELVPVAADPAIARSYSPGKLSPQRAAEEWPKLVPGLLAKIEGRKVLIQGTIEELEALEAHLHPERNKKPAGTNEPQPVEQREFTLRVMRVPARAILDKLAQSGITFEYDAQQLAAAGVDLEQRVTLDLNKARAPEFFKALLDPLGADFEIEGTTVRIRSKEQ